MRKFPILLLFTFLMFQVLMRAQSTALGTPLDTDKLSAVTQNMKAVKEIRNTENTAFSERNEDLWLGEFNTVRHSCQREVLGYVTSANMAYTVGAHVGYGFVSLKGLQKWRALAPNPKNLVLTRETTSLQYRFSTLTVL